MLGLGLSLSNQASQARRPSDAQISVPWYLQYGIPLSDFLALWQPEGAPSLAVSYIDKITGTYPAVPGVAPALVAAGWVGNGVKYLTTGLTATVLPAHPANYCMGAKIVVAGGASGVAIGRGSVVPNAWMIGVVASGVPGDSAAYGLGVAINGIVLNGCDLWINGVFVVNFARGGDVPNTIYLMARNDPIGGPSDLLDKTTLGAAFVLSDLVTDSQAAGLSSRMQLAL